MVPGEFVIAETRLAELSEIERAVNGLPTIKLWKDLGNLSIPVFSGQGDHLIIRPLDSPLVSFSIENDGSSAYELIPREVENSRSSYVIGPRILGDEVPYKFLLIYTSPSKYLMENVFVRPEKLDELDDLDGKARKKLIKNLKKLDYFKSNFSYK